MHVACAFKRDGPAGCSIGPIDPGVVDPGVVDLAPVGTGAGTMGGGHAGAIHKAQPDAFSAAILAA